MTKHYNVLSSADGDTRIVHSFAVVSDKSPDRTTEEMVDLDFAQKAKENLEEFIDSLYVEEE